MKIKIRRLLIVLVFLCPLAFVPTMQAVAPAPDGGYPGGNTAEGQSALLSLTTGGFNTAVGFFSLRSNTTGEFNTATGAGALLFNNGDATAGEASENTAIGVAALLSNTTGFRNTANGAFALFSNTTGIGNTANGRQALLSNTTGGLNTATGYEALVSNTTGGLNTATGLSALGSNTAGNHNTATGVYALDGHSTGNGNTANGYQALTDNDTGSGNTASGFWALFSNSTGDGNTATGDRALTSNTTGAGNTAIGNQALYHNTTGSYNVALNGGYNLTTGHFNLHIANDGVADESNTTRIGILQNRCFISGIRDVTTGIPDAISVMIDSAGQLGTVSSSRRFKDEIKPMDQTSEAILHLKPVTFHYKSDHTARSQFGLIAEEVAAVNPDLVVRDNKGEIYTVRYDQVNAMLLNEFLKEHKRVEEQDGKLESQARRIQEQEITVSHLASDVATLARTVKEQAAQIQKVSDKLFRNWPVLQTVVENR